MAKGHAPSPPLPVVVAPAATSRAERVAVKIRLHPDTKARTAYWAAKNGMSENEFMANAVDFFIAYQNGDYPLATLEIARLNQLVDEMHSLSANVANLEETHSSTMSSLLGLTRGDSYLFDADSGELTKESQASTGQVAL